MARVTISMPDELLLSLDAAARDDGVSRSDIVREAASLYMAERSVGARARRRQAAVDEGIAWLESVAAKPSVDARLGVEILREVRGDEILGSPIEQDDEEHLP